MLIGFQFCKWVVVFVSSLHSLLRSSRFRITIDFIGGGRAQRLYWMYSLIHILSPSRRFFLNFVQRVVHHTLDANELWSTVHSRMFFVASVLNYSTTYCMLIFVLKNENLKWPREYLGRSVYHVFMFQLLHTTVEFGQCNMTECHAPSAELRHTFPRPELSNVEYDARSLAVVHSPPAFQSSAITAQLCHIPFSTIWLWIIGNIPHKIELNPRVIDTISAWLTVLSRPSLAHSILVKQHSE